jgi:hypothetical protein
MTAWQNALPVDSENRGCFKTVHQVPGGFGSILRTASEHDQWTACLPEEISGNSY